MKEPMTPQRLQGARALKGVPAGRQLLTVLWNPTMPSIQTELRQKTACVPFQKARNPSSFATRTQQSTMPLYPHSGLKKRGNYPEEKLHELLGLAPESCFLWSGLRSRRV